MVVKNPSQVKAPQAKALLRRLLVMNRPPYPLRRPWQFAYPDPQDDILSSVRIGHGSVPPACQTAMIVLGDEPRISAEPVDLLCSEYDKCEETLLVPAFRGKRGHTFIMAMAHRAEVMWSFDSEGVRGPLHGHPEELRMLPVDDSAILLDMDTMEHYEREVAATQGSGEGEQ